MVGLHPTCDFSPTVSQEVAGFQIHSHDHSLCKCVFIHEATSWSYSHTFEAYLPKASLLPNHKLDTRVSSVEEDGQDQITVVCISHCLLAEFLT